MDRGVNLRYLMTVVTRFAIVIAALQAIAWSHWGREGRQVSRADVGTYLILIAPLWVMILGSLCNGLCVLANGGKMPVKLIEGLEVDGAVYCSITQKTRFVLLADIFVCDIGERKAELSVGDILIFGATLSVFLRLLLFPLLL